MTPEIIDIRPAPGGAGGVVARFDVQLNGLRLFNVALKQTTSGYRVFAPSAFGCATATFTHETAALLIEAALGEIRQNDRNSASAN
ncbi:MAG: hypothetical protein ACTHNH_20960 [Mesorhizobium sp.]